MITIRKNDYVESEPREEVIQMICDAFLCGRTYAPHSHTHVEKGGILARFDFSNGHSLSQEAKHIKFTREEMRIAFQELIKAGYHMMMYHDTLRNYNLYECHKSSEPEGLCDIEVFKY